MAGQLNEADTLGSGQATYEHMAAYWPTQQAQANDPAITSRMNGIDKLVFSRTITDANWSGNTLPPPTTWGRSGPGPAKTC